MRHKLLVVALFGAIAGAALLVWKSRAGTAPLTPVADSKVAKPVGPTLAIGQVILFSSGVGYYQREGEVDGNAHVDLSFPSSDVNDLLKSLVLQDQGGGAI